MPTKSSDQHFVAALIKKFGTPSQLLLGVGLAAVVVGAVVITNMVIRNGSSRQFPASQAPNITKTVDMATATPVLSTTSAITNLEDNALQWGIFQDGGSATGTLANVKSPSIDGTALKVSLVGGQPYVGIHAYRNLPAANMATTFELNLYFSFTHESSIQALEFTVSKWMNNWRWEWALQWEHLGDGGPQQGNPPTWRLWTGKSWHFLHLYGDISNGQVHYITFSCDGISANLSQMFDSVSSPGDKLAVAVQLDGDNHEDSYQMYIDGVDLLWG